MINVMVMRMTVMKMVVGLMHLHAFSCPVAVKQQFIR